MIEIKRYDRQPTFLRRSPQPNPLVMTKRRYAILNWLGLLNYLETSQIARFLYKAGSRKLAERHLRQLYDAGYVQRFRVPVIQKWSQIPHQYMRHRTIHTLSARGRMYVKQYGVFVRHLHKYNPKTVAQFGNLEHTIALNEFLLCANRAASNTKMNFDIIHYDRGNRIGRIQPDSMFRFVIPPLNTGMYCLVELDRGTESSQKIKRKIERYVRLYESGEYFRQFKTTSCRVLFVAADYRMFTNDLPRTEAEWQAQLQRRCAALNQWIMEVNRRHDLFWVAPLYTITPHNFFHASIWEHDSKKVSFIGDNEIYRKKAESG
jgi:hypothetical protein